MAIRAFLWLSALVWLPYGLFCFFQPGFLAGAAGVAANSATGTIELRAMYGGLQAAIGVLSLMAALRPRLQPAALMTLLFLFAGLGVARLAGVALDGQLSVYTGGALVFELLGAGVAAWLLGRAGSEVVTA